MAQPWPSTIGLAIMAAYWLLVLLFILFGLGCAMMATARAKTSRFGYGGVLCTSMLPALFSVGAGIEGHPAWALVASLAAILLSLWWMHNIAKREH
jgi:hypothetical protein